MKRDNQTGKFKKSATYIDRICENCGDSFQIKKSRLKYGGGKCCSRTCVDENKKKTYKGENNPMYGKSFSDATLEKKSSIAKKLWKDPDFVKKVKKSKDKFFDRASKDGTWERAKKKRETTLLKKYGITHIWNGEYGNRDCDITCVNRHGSPSHKIAQDKLKSQSSPTKIELITESILCDHGIEYIAQYSLDGYSFDFYLPDNNTLIECDGNYWHGYGKLDEELDEIQKNNKKNDLIKNEIAKTNNITLLRFWEHEIHQKDFDKQLLKNI